MGAVLIEDHVRRLREALGATNDADLALKLGLSRFAVAKWKKRGAIPPRYRFIIDRPDLSGVDAAVQFIAHDHIFSHPDNHFWLRAALSLLPTGIGDSLPADLRARHIEFTLTRLMDAACDATISCLGKPRCESEDDYSELIVALAGPYDERVKRVLSDASRAEQDARTPQSPPQSKG